MGKVVLKNGTIITTTQQQQDALAVIILTADNLERVVRVGGHTFKLSDIEADPKKIIQISQSEMFDKQQFNRQDKQQI